MDTPKDERSEIVKAVKDEIGFIENIDKVYRNPLEIAKIAADKLKGKADEFMPKANITDEEIEILRSQHLTKEGIDFVLAESYQEDFERQDRVEEISARIEQLEKEQQEWELAEKDRVREMLIADWKRRQSGFRLPLPDDCFIATAVYGSPGAVEIVVFRAFRDEVLLSTRGGSKLVDLYYRFSPPVASYLTEKEKARTAVRLILVEPLVRFLQAVR